MRPLIACNPSLYLEKYIPLIKELGIPTLQFSLDSGNPFFHDEIRGVGSHSNTLRFMSRLIDRKINCNLSVCLSRRNVSDVESIVKLSRNTGIYKLKFVIWNPGDSDADGRSALDAHDILNLLATLKTYMPDDENWITLASYDINSGVRFLKKLPSVVVMPDGDISDGEFGVFIGEMRDGHFSDSYDVYINKRKYLFLKNILFTNATLNGICLYLNDRHIDGIGGSVFKYNSEYYVTTNSDLAPLESIVVALHELGHIIDGSVIQNPRLLRKSEFLLSERNANQYVLSLLEPYIPNLRSLLSDVDPGSDLFYTRIAHCVSRGLHLF